MILMTEIQNHMNAVCNNTDIAYGYENDDYDDKTEIM